MKTAKFFLVASFLLVMASCGGGGDPPKTQTSTNTDPPPQILPQENHQVTLILQNGSLPQLIVSYAHDASGNITHMAKADGTAVTYNFQSVSNVQAFVEGKCEAYVLLTSSLNNYVASFTFTKLGDVISVGLLVQGSQKFYLKPEYIQVAGPIGMIAVNNTNGDIIWGAALASLNSTSLTYCKEILQNETAMVIK